MPSFEVSAENLLVHVAIGIQILADGMPRANVRRTIASSFTLTIMGKSSTCLPLLLQPNPKLRVRLKPNRKPKLLHASLPTPTTAHLRVKRRRWNSEASETCKTSRVADPTVPFWLWYYFATCCQGTIRQERHQAVLLPTEASI